MAKINEQYSFDGQFGGKNMGSGVRHDFQDFSVDYIF